MSPTSETQPETPRQNAWAIDEWLSSAALALMVLIPVIEIAMRPWMGRGIENAFVLVQHLK